jgi:hypothetical protein
MRAHLPVASAAVVGLLASHWYLHWITTHGVLSDALDASGRIGYWLWFYGPVLVLLVAFLNLAPRGRLSKLGFVLLWAAVATLVYFAGAFGSLLACMLVGQTSCM